MKSMSILSHSKPGGLSQTARSLAATSARSFLSFSVGAAELVPAAASVTQTARAVLKNVRYMGGPPYVVRAGGCAAAPAGSCGRSDRGRRRGPSAPLAPVIRFSAVAGNTAIGRQHVAGGQRGAAGDIRSEVAVRRRLGNLFHLVVGLRGQQRQVAATGW